MTPALPTYDLLVIGGGINGVGVARDAAGRGLKVLLVEQDDLGAHTSSASTKLIHGGLRYLETYQFRLVREALGEREKLLRIARHISRPLSFVLPLLPDARPGWMIRIGLLLYDRLGGRSTLPRSHAIRLSADGYGAGLKAELRSGFAYVDGWVDDARLVILNAMDARERGAEIRTRTRLTAARREPDGWVANLIDTHTGQGRQVRARALVNAGGPWVDAILANVAGARSERPSRLVKGSHIVVPRLYAGDHAYLLQNADGRVVLTIPYEGSFTLIGTTDVNWSGDPSAPHIDPAEVQYLCDAISRVFVTPVSPTDVLYSFSGIRALYDDGAAKASKVTRDYVLASGCDGAPQLLSVFGGKITTYRRLAEHALAKLAEYLPAMGPAWTATAPLPGADMDDLAAFLATVRSRWPFLSSAAASRLARAYGTRMSRFLGDAKTMADLGHIYGGADHGLTDAEIDYLIAEEWAVSAEDILWRRTKLGLHLPPDVIAEVRSRLGETAHG